jgi:hypothetical protein
MVDRNKTYNRSFECILSLFDEFLHEASKVGISDPTRARGCVLAHEDDKSLTRSDASRKDKMIYNDFLVIECCFLTTQSRSNLDRKRSRVELKSNL